jgi:integrase/recombinase XerD
MTKLAATAAPDLDLEYLLDSWLRDLRGARKSRHTLRSYEAAVRAFLAYCAQNDVPAELTKATVQGWLAAQSGAETSTARLRLTALKLFARWLAAEEGFDADPITAVKAPKLDQKPVPHLSEDEVRRLLKVCDGPDIRDKRDRAMLVLLAESGLRAAELLALDVTDIDLDACTLLVRRGKGGKARRIRFSPGAAAAVDKYTRARRRAVLHPATGPLWVSNHGRLTYSGLVQTLQARAQAAGVEGFHAHRLRHTAAVRWLNSGGSEAGLMAHAGWSNRSMIDRYVKSAAEQIAAEEFDRLNLGLVDL